MSAKPISEHTGKQLLSHWLTSTPATDPSISLNAVSRSASLDAASADLAQSFAALESTHPWLKSEKLVVKPDQLIKRRGKNGLLGVNLSWDQAKDWIRTRANTEVKIEKTTGTLHKFILEPFIPHPANTEYYICIYSLREGDVILFSEEGGVDVGDVDAKAKKFFVSIQDSTLTGLNALFKDVPKEAHATLTEFIRKLYKVYVRLQFTYLEINPLVVLPSASGGGFSCYYLDLAAKIDQTAEFECGKDWAVALGNKTLEFPPPFGRRLTKEEGYIAELDGKTGASLKLTILNEKGRVWTMVAGGGASVVFTDAIAAEGFGSEIANYGEYSGAPSTSQTYEYARTILDLMTRGPVHPDGKILFIGGGIANFTNVAGTFKGIIQGLMEFKGQLKVHGVKIYVRRAGPNYQEGLRLMRNLADELELDMWVFGPEMFITGIVPLALKGDASGMLDKSNTKGTSNDLQSMMSGSSPSVSPTERKSATNALSASKTATTTTAITTTKPNSNTTFSPKTRSFVYGMQPRAVQGMLDFDFMCKRTTPSVAAMIYPFGGHHVQKFYWGTKEIMVPVYTSTAEALKSFPDVDCVVNFASFRSVYGSTRELLSFPEIKTIAVIAEGVPERRTRELICEAKEKGVLIIGPATVGGIKAGSFKIGNTGGMMDNIVSSKLYRPGSVAYVSKSGGMSNELNNIISLTTDGVCEGVAIGGDRYPGSTFIDHMLRYEGDDSVKMMVLLGEVGGVEEYEVSKAIMDGRIKKPVVGWCIGTCAKMFTTDVQFGHAGSFANSDVETADAKNAALAKAGVHVPESFEQLPVVLSKVYEELVKKGVIVVKKECEVPKIPIDYSWAQELGLVRKPASFISTICDDRGQELSYAGMAISEVFSHDIGVGGVLSLLWFKRSLPPYACKFIEMVLMLTADHGPAVSGAHNTIVTARAGKDLISSLVTGLLTIGERFGGALDGAAQMFSEAYDAGQTPQEFVDAMRKSHKLILGIGHRIKSLTNPDLRVEIIKNFVKKNFVSCECLNFALEVEKITTSKKDNLILNVDGAVGVAFVDLLRSCGAFSRAECEEYIKIGTLNGLFVLGRSIGFIGHYLDQKRLKQGLYRHPWDDITYLTGEEGGNGNGGLAGASVQRTMVPSETVVGRGVERSV